jgi:hypothetical protein
VNKTQNHTFVRLDKPVVYGIMMEIIMRKPGFIETTETAG